MHHEEDDSNLLEQMGYEGRDVSYGRGAPISAFLGFVVLTVLVLLCWVFIGLIDRTYTFTEAPRTVPPRTLTPPKGYPIIQSDVTARTDIIDLRKHEAVEEAKLGWADKDKGVAVVPIDTAIKIVAERGLPSKPTVHDGQGIGGGQP